MRVMLIQPPMFHLKMQLSPNLGLAYIAAVLERDGFEVQVLDAAAENLDFDGVIERIRAFSPSVIGAGGQTPVSRRSMTIFARAKEEISQDIVTVAGGPHFSFADRESLAECPQLDVIVRGEGEETMSHLCKRVAAGEPLDDLRGITWRNEQGEVVRNPDRPPIARYRFHPFSGLASVSGGQVPLGGQQTSGNILITWMPVSLPLLHHLEGTPRCQAKRPGRDRGGDGVGQEALRPRHLFLPG